MFVAYFCKLPIISPLTKKNFHHVSEYFAEESLNWTDANHYNFHKYRGFIKPDITCKKLNVTLAHCALNFSRDTRSSSGVQDFNDKITISIKLNIYFLIYSVVYWSYIMFGTHISTAVVTTWDLCGHMLKRKNRLRWPCLSIKLINRYDVDWTAEIPLCSLTVMISLVYWTKVHLHKYWRNSLEIPQKQ